MDKTLLDKQWFLLETLHKYPLMHLSAPLTGMYELGMETMHSAHEYKEGATKMFFVEEEWRSVGKHFLDKIIEDPSWMDELHRESNEELVPKIQTIAKQTLETDLTSYSNEELLAVFDGLYEVMQRLQVIRMVAWIMEGHLEQFSGYLSGMISDVISKKNLDLNPTLVIATLTTPTAHTIMSEEHLDLLELAQKVQRGDIALDVSTDEIKQHADTYAFLPFGCVGPAWTAKDIVTSIAEITDAGVEVDIDKQIEDHHAQLSRTKEQQEELYTQLQLTDQQKHVVQIAHDFMYQRGWSKEHQYMAWYALHDVFKEIARRLYISPGQVPYMLAVEIRAALREGVHVETNILHERMRYCVFVIDGVEVDIIYGEEGREIIDNMNVAKKEEVDVEGVREVFGQTAVPGNVQGVVKIVNSVADMEKIESGDILVSEMTIPEIVSAMKRAGAIVTDQGGITCHAAIVSRELGTPCLIGTKIATAVFTDGDEVIVDATNGMVKKC